MNDWVTAFFMAWGMFCAVPCPSRRWDEGQREKMLLCLPGVGLLIGLLWMLGAWAFGGLGLFGAVLTAAVPYLATGFLHLDGFMDCADAVLSRRDQAARRSILKDSHVGSFAVIALVLLLLLTTSLFAGGVPAGRRIGLLLLPAATRACASAAVLSLPPLPGSSYAGMFAAGTDRKSRAAAWVLTAVFALLPAVFCRGGEACGLAAAAGFWLTALGCRKSLGGMSGDISGCAITIGELCGVAALLLG